MTGFASLPTLPSFHSEQTARARAGTMSLDLTGEQKFQAGLLQARTPGNFEQITFQPARQRLNFERNGDGLSVVNGLGTTVKRLYYRDGGQMYALAKELPAGERASLKNRDPEGS